MKNQWRLILILLLVLIIVSFAVLNVAPVVVNFGFGTTKWPLILVIIVALLLGALITVLVSTTNSLGVRRQHKALTKENAELKQSVQKQVAAKTKDFKDQLVQKDNQIKTLKAQIAETEATDLAASESKPTDKIQ
ncbi:LapA family protein [Loigolactobacillus iwatensis]|uniref:LapA family protein n=1 Tax=Loigolactobacillus iwatensis TaxID=1267156 RepID=UPI000F7E7ADA|nr:LapA family protein [Loigolactobacillus iwatensis]